MAIEHRRSQESDPRLESRAIAAATAIPAHVVEAKGHGHAGTAMALAPLSHVLFSRVLRHNPANPDWAVRDRFVLSAGHASLLLYVQLFLTGYGLTLDDIAASRKLGSLTPGHPERGHTPGVDMSTGPLGQGVASAVGMALAARREAALFAGDTGMLDQTIWVVAGDGCLQEGVSGEASSLAGTLGLDNLVLIWDDNSITIDSGSVEAFSEDVRARYRAYGWRVLEIDDATDTELIESVLRSARESDGRPTFVALRSVIGAPSVRFSGTSAAHSGGFGAEEVAAVKVALGFAADAPLKDLVSDEVLAYTRLALDRGVALERAWREQLARWDGADAWLAFRAGADAAAQLAAIDSVALAAPGSPVATRKTNGAVITALADLRTWWGGSADLAGSTNVAVPGSAVSADNPGGEFVRFGIREHAMAAILTGIALHGPWRPFGSTYLVFSDYMRPSIRLAALMQVPVVYVFTHDSVAVGEDGPTHQPVEQVASLRIVPGLDVVRPADAAEVLAVWRRLVSRPAGPTALILGRQDVPVLGARDNIDVGVANGGYVAWQSGAGDELAIIATGSEVSLAIEAGSQLADVAVRVISMPSVEWFVEASDEYRESVLPSSLTARVAVEAGRSDGWWRFAGTRGEVIGVEAFGESGSGPEILALRGITVDAVLAAARSTLART
ncbi:transketolase [Glaciihabitans arcticus]|uniref:transketolase n=1 Tax=Glaciihabitans arcticus TaxID=2668039 RepID=A0A4Q9GS72_9MICO|nr:transketolase [Glaciihabitans arcticus]TBN56974.1 transketolase [Glaciihabitans arcticus]